MNRLKVLLIKPYASADELIPPLGLGYLATAIRDRHEVAIIDGLKEKLTARKFARLLTTEQPDICCLQVFTFQIPPVKEYLTVGQKVSPRTKFILGGPHPSADAPTIFQLFPQAAFAFKGEAELGLAKLLDLLAAGKPSEADLVQVPGLIWRQGENTVVNQQNFHCDLDGLGLPAWDLLAPHTYPLAPHGGFFKNYPTAPIIITRGCPFSCTYCSGHLTSGKKIRSRSAANAVAEIKLLHDIYGIREIHIEDDNFTFDRQLVLNFCQQLKEVCLNISWTCPNGVRLDTLDKELLLTMKDAGLYSLSVGIESGSDKILRDIKKNLTTAQIRAKIALIKNCGLTVTGFFILGYPTETLADIKATIKFACQLPLQRASFALFKPFPGTAAAQELIAKGELDDKSAADWAHYILADAVYAPPDLTTGQMKWLRRQALMRFYLRPRVIWQFLKQIKNLRHLKLILKRAYSWLFAAK